MEAAASYEEEMMKHGNKPTGDVKLAETASDSLVKALVYNQLQEVSLTLAAEFAAMHKFEFSLVKLDKIIEVYSQSDVHDCDVRELEVQVDEGSVGGKKGKDGQIPHEGKEGKIRNRDGKSSTIKLNESPDTTINLTQPG